MRTINGKLVCETIEEVVAPGHTALVVVDVQNDFCSPGGQFDQIGKNLSGPRGMLPHLVALRGHCRELGVKTIFIKNTTLPNGQSDSPAWVYDMHRGPHRRGDLSSYTLEVRGDNSSLPNWRWEQTNEISSSRSFGLAPS